MFMRLCSTTVLAIGVLLGAAAVPEWAAAGVPNISAGEKQSTKAASMNREYLQLAQRRGGGGGARSRGARPSGGHNVNRNANINSNRKGNANVNTNVNRSGNTNVNRNVNRNANVNVNRNVNVTVRNYGWRGARWGAVAFGVTMGAVIVVAANTPPYPPHPSLCWTWTNAALTSGYWYYCSGP